MFGVMQSRIFRVFVSWKTNYQTKLSDEQS